jgi:hypothetical protein
MKMLHLIKKNSAAQGQNCKLSYSGAEALGQIFSQIASPWHDDLLQSRFTIE